MTRLPIDGEDPWGVVRADWDLTEHNNDGTHKFSGTPTGTKFLRDDRTWAAPPGGGGGTLTSWFDVKATYGAAGDGVADDTAEVNAAVAAASAAGGGVVYFPVGVYKYVASSQLDVPSNVTLLGAGWGSILLLTASGGNGNVRLPTGNSGITIENMTIRRGSTTAGRLLDIHSDNCTIRRVRFQSNTFAGTGVNVGQTGNLFAGCLFDSINGFAIAANAATGLRVLGNRFEAQTGGQAIYLNTNCSAFVISDNEIFMDAASSSQAIGGYTVGAGTYIRHGRINNNYIETTSFGIEVVKTSVGDFPEFVTINGNVTKALAGSYTGISVVGMNCPVKGNAIDCNGIAGLYTGIEIVDSDSCPITGNSIDGDGSLETGIILDKSSNCAVSVNTVRGFRDATTCQAIRVYADGTSSADNNSITGNHLHFPTGATASLECGIKLQPNAAGASVDGTLISGNTIYGNNVANSRGVSLDPGAGSLDSTLIGHNVILNCSAPIIEFGGTNTRREGAVWNATGTLASSVVQSGTAYTLALTDSEKTVETTNGSAVTVTVPPNSSVPFLLGTVVEVGQYGAGQVTIAAGAGVTIRSPSGKLKITGQYSKAALVKRGTDEWWLEGDITT